MSLAAICGCAGKEAEKIDFSESRTFHVGVHPVVAAVGDFDGDGHTDVAAAGGLSTHVALLTAAPGLPEYHFGAPLRTGAAGAVALDLDGDGIDEAVFAEFDENSLSILKFDGANWTLLQELDLQGAREMEVADVDSNGWLDIIITRFEFDDMIFALSDGSGQLNLSLPIPVGNGPQDAVYYETDDGPRIAVPSVSTQNGPGSLAILGGAPQWEVIAETETLAWPSWVEVAELDGEPGVELVGAANIGNAIFVAKPGPSEIAIEHTPAGFGAFSTVALDFSGDGRDDVILSNKWDHELALYENVDGELTLRQTIETPQAPSPIYKADLDLDGQVDLAVVNAVGDSVSVFFGR